MALSFCSPVVHGGASASASVAHARVPSCHCDAIPSLRVSRGCLGNGVSLCHFLVNTSVTQGKLTQYHTGDCERMITKEWCDTKSTSEVTGVLHHRRPYYFRELVAGYPPVSTNRVQPRLTYLLFVQCLHVRFGYVRLTNVENPRVDGKLLLEVAQSLTSQRFWLW